MAAKGVRAADRPDGGGSPLRGSIAKRHPRAMQHRILMVEEDRDEVELLRSAFEEMGLPIALDVAIRPDDCLDRLRSPGPSPEVVLLDLDQSPVAGRRLLQSLKHDDHLRHVPVLLFTMGDDPTDVRDCYRDHAAACVCKPVGMDEYRSMAEGLYTFWFEVAILPEGVRR